MGKRVPQSTSDTWHSLRRRGFSFREIADITGCPQSTIANHLLGVRGRQYDPSKYEPTYQTPARREDDEGFHLQCVAEANDGYGFPVVTEPLLSRLYLLEVAPTQPRWFWRAA